MLHVNSKLEQLNMQRRDPEKHLRTHGCHLDHHGGRHDVWRNPANGHQEPLPRHREINNFTAAAICRGLGIPKPEMKQLQPAAPIATSIFS